MLEPPSNMSSVYDNVVSVISKPPKERSSKEILSLLPWLKKKSDVFGSLSQDVLTDIIRNCSFVTRPRDYVIIKQGTKGDCFYIILRGSVSIYINSLISDEEDEAKIAEYYRNDADFVDDQGDLDRSKFGNFIVQFVTGKSFGELALINKNTVRNASIIADEWTDLLVVNKELYDRSLKAAQAAEFEERNNFVKYHPFFSEWSPKHKKQLAMSLEKARFPFEGSICRQGEPANRLHFLLRGQAKILMDPSQHQSQYPHLYPLQDPDDIVAREELELDSLLRLPPKKKETASSKNEKVISLAPSAQRIRERVRKLTELSIVGEKEVIGDAEFILELKSYLQSVECAETCEVYVLDMKNYERLVVKKNHKTVDLVREHAQVKLRGRISRLGEDDVPLLKTLLFRMERMDRSYALRHRKKIRQSPTWTDVVPQRGPLIDMFGPGTVFYRAKMREESLRKKNQKQQQQQQQQQRARNANLHVPLSQILANNGRSTSTESLDVIKAGVDASCSEADGDVDDEAAVERANANISDRLIHPYGTPFLDYKSSDRVLTMLEERIKLWHSSVAAIKSHKQIKPGIVKLERVRINKNKELVPGRTVILRRKRPRAAEVRGSASRSSSDPTQERLPRPLSRGPTNDSLCSTGSLKAPVHRRRVPRAEEKAPAKRAIDYFSGSLLTPQRFLRLYLRRSSPADDDWDDDGDDRRPPPPPESEGTILDIMKRRERLEGKIVGGLHTGAEQFYLQTLRQLYIFDTELPEPAGDLYLPDGGAGPSAPPSGATPTPGNLFPPIQLAIVESARDKRKDSSALPLSEMPPLVPVGGSRRTDVNN